MQLSAKRHWNLDNIPWSDFDPERVDDRVRWVVEATCLVESRADLYSAYVGNVLAEDEEAVQTIERWGVEEAQHGDALRRWLELADPSFDFDRQNRIFRSSVPYYQLDGKSVRGSVQNELLCRCVVESLASAYYRAILDATTEPTLRRICELLARDEARHFKMFRSLLSKEREKGKNGLLENLLIVHRRVRDLENDQVAFAFHCSDDEKTKNGYDTQAAAADFLPTIYSLYQVEHIAYALKLIFVALDLEFPRPIVNLGARVIHWSTRVRSVVLRTRTKLRKVMRRNTNEIRAVTR